MWPAMYLKYFMTRLGELSRYNGSLLSEESGYRKPVGATFSIPVRTGLVAHTASYKMGNGSGEEKRLGQGVDH